MPKLNPKQAAVIKKVAGGKSQTQAYKEEYGVKNDRVAQAASSRMLSNVISKNALQESLRANGHDEQGIADKLTSIGNNREWRAQSDYVEKVSSFLGYGEEKQTQVNIAGNELAVEFIS